MTVVVRPRTPWEAIDLGFAMARQWFVPLWTLWWITALPVNLLLAILLNEHYWVMAVLAWWLKPLYEPPLQFWLSRALFAERIPVRQLIRRWPQLVRPRLLANLTWARLAPSRSFYMPVALLEGLRGGARTERIAILGQRQQAGFWLTVVGLHFEMVLEFGFVIFLMVLLPEELQWLDWEVFFMSPGTVEHWLDHGFNLLAMSLIAPFYVAGGFALYLSRRIELEAWDIEIAFRRMSKRAGRAKGPAAVRVAALTLLAVVCVTPPPEAWAQTPTSEEARQLIQEILEDSDFGRREKETYFEFVGESSEEGIFKDLLDILGDFFADLAPAFEVLMWAAVAAAVVFVVYRISRNRQWLRPAPVAVRKDPAAAAVRLFGLDLRPQNLPADIVGESRALLRDGRSRDALSLLYRGMLSRLVHELGVEIPSSATEGECRRVVRLRRPSDEADYFDRLSGVWIHMAYGHRVPAPGQVEELCGDWRAVFGQNHAR